MKGIGLVFSGGGGKGAYEIGVWKYLHEIGLDQYVKAVSGTSVGALNAALFVGSTFEEAEHIWKNIEPSDILSPSRITINDITSWIIGEGLDIAKNQVSLASVVDSAVVDMKNVVSIFARMLSKSILRDHFFSREGLKKIIESGIDFNRLNNNDIPCFVTCLRCPECTIDRFKLNDYDIHDVESILLASSAIPIIYPKERFNDNYYYDGGVPMLGDNVPIKPLYDMEIENIIVVHLKQDEIINKDVYPNSRIIEIIPSQDLGNALTGTLDFTLDGLQKRAQLGYEDTKRVLQPMIDMLYLKEERQKILNAFQNRRSDLIKEESRIKKEMENDGFDELYRELMGGD